ncbi:MAG TPA: hypothetical protein VLH77_04195, partial [Gammaproteobacteria bacterium]|nr:hypothetical protein [Gammaproteobacteria bacterium]
MREVESKIISLPTSLKNPVIASPRSVWAWQSSHKVEIKDNFIHLTFDEASDPTTNICVGVRWLFMKYAGARERITKAKLDRLATWDDAVAEYK